MIIKNEFDLINRLTYFQKSPNIINTVINNVVYLFNSLLISPLLQIYPQPRTYMMTHEGLMNLHYLLLQSIIRNRNKGNIIEVGCYEGLTAIMLSKTLQQFNLESRLILYDSFQGLQNFSKEDEGIFLERGNCQSTPDRVYNNFKIFHAKRPKLVVGSVKETFPKQLPEKIVFAHIDLDLYEPTLLSLKYIYPRLVKGGIIVFDDYSHPLIPGVQRAVFNYFKDKDVQITKLYAGFHPLLPKIWPKFKGKYVLKKYQAYLTK